MMTFSIKTFLYPKMSEKGIFTVSQKVTIKDVAREAGVSISTVSNALNDVDVLNPDTKKHVLDVARRLHYMPNLNGRNLKAQKTKVIGLFLNSIAGPYYGSLVESINRSCRKEGYELNIYISDMKDRLMANILGNQVDGAIISNEHVGQEEEKLLEENELPVVFIDRERKGKFMSSVVFDSYHEGEMAARYLLELGHMTFGYVKGEANNFDDEERQRGFTDVLRRAGIILPQEYIWRGEYERNAAYESMMRFLETGGALPEAIFAANDLSAIGTIEALTEAGIKVPEQVSVIGCDDIEMARFFKPAVTTIRTSFESQGIRAVQHLISMIKEKEEGVIDVLYGRIIPRESTCLRE